MTTLKGVLRTMEASARRAEREAKRRQRELERQQKEYDKLMEHERASYEVELYENNIAVLQSMHQDCGDICNWQKIKNIKAPSKPIKKYKNEEVAKANLINYKPTFFQKLFGKVEKIKQILSSEVENAKRKDEENYNNELKQYEEEKKDWEENIDIAEKIISGDLTGYKQAFEKLNPLSEVNELGTSLNISFPHKDIIIVDINMFILMK